MPRTTLDIDEPILRELRQLQQREGKSLGRLVSDLLAGALSRTETEALPPKLDWVASPGDLQVDLLDKDAIFAALDGESRGR